MPEIKFQMSDGRVEGHYVVVFEDGHEETADNYDEAMEIVQDQ